MFKLCDVIISVVTPFRTGPAFARGHFLWSYVHKLLCMATYCTLADDLIGCFIERVKDMGVKERLMP